jgi:DNA-binding NarL/FixJ family response regulator
MKTILLVDDHPIITLGLRKALDGRSGWQVLGEARTPDEALRMTRSLQPQIVLMDMELEDDTAERVTCDLVCDCHTKVVVFSGFSKPAYIRAMADAGASGYIIKGAPVAELIAALDVVHAGGTYFRGQVAEALANAPCSGVKDLLTSRERDVLALLAHGNTTGEIATRLGIAESTVKTHRTALMDKLNAENAADLCRIAFELGLMSGLVL